MQTLTNQTDFEGTALPHLDDLFRAARHVLGNATEAQDVVQETYLQAWKSFHRFEPGTNCRAWLFKILFHVIHHYRRKWYRLRLANEGEDLFGNLPAYEMPLPERLTEAQIMAAFEKLPAQFREVVMLADVQEFSYKEVAETLGIPLGTVMSRLSRGRKLLRQQLAPIAADYGIVGLASA